MPFDNQSLALQDLARANRLAALKRTGHASALFDPIDSLFEVLITATPLAERG